MQQAPAARFGEGGTVRGLPRPGMVPRACGIVLFSLVCFSRPLWAEPAASFVWEQLPRFPEARGVAGPFAGVSGAVLLTAGGAEEPGEQAAVNRLFALDLSQAKPAWQERAACPGKPRILPVAAVQDGAFFLVGGCALERVGGKISRVYLQDAWRYQPGRGWKRIADPPRPVAAAPSPAPALGQSHFLVVGGDDGSKLGFEPAEQHPGFSREILAYHSITDTWTVVGEMPGSRVTVPVVRWNRRFVLPSGELRPGVRSPEVWALSVKGAKAGFGWLDYATLVQYLPSLALATVSQLDVTTCILAMGVLVIVYTVLGGIEAVIWTDVAPSSCPDGRGGLGAGRDPDALGARAVEDSSYENIGFSSDTNRNSPKLDRICCRFSERHRGLPVGPGGLSHLPDSIRPGVAQGRSAGVLRRAEEQFQRHGRH
jgi:hypothetical protein